VVRLEKVKEKINDLDKLLKNPDKSKQH